MPYVSGIWVQPKGEDTYTQIGGGQTGATIGATSGIIPAVQNYMQNYYAHAAQPGGGGYGGLQGALGGYGGLGGGYGGLGGLTGPQGSYGVQGAVQGAGYGNYGPGLSPADFVKKQEAEWNRTDALNQKYLDMYLGPGGAFNKVMPNYEQDPTVKGVQNRVRALLNDPEAINNMVQGQIQARAGNAIDAETAERMKTEAGALAAGGQSDAASIAAMQERLGAQNMAQRASTFSNLEIERALRRNQDIQNAIAAGQAQAGQEHGLEASMAQLLGHTLPQYLPRNYGGLLALMGPMGMGGTLGGAPRMGGLGVGPGMGYGAYGGPLTPSGKPYLGLGPWIGGYGGGANAGPQRWTGFGLGVLGGGSSGYGGEHGPTVPMNYGGPYAIQDLPYTPPRPGSRPGVDYNTYGGGSSAYT